MKKLVIIHLAGGNDGLNTVLPLDQEQKYRESRGALAIPFSRALKLTDTVGLHPSLQPFQILYETGRMSIIQNVGMLNNDFSHFRASDIWATASNADEYLSTGWAGRAIDMTTTLAPGGITIGSTPNLITRGLAGKSINVESIDSLYDFATDLELSPHEKVAFIRDLRIKTEGYMAEVKKAADNKPGFTFDSNTSLGKQLEMVSRLIAGGLETQIYFCQTSGFDTHAAQVNSGDSLTGMHSLLLNSLAKDIEEFIWFSGKETTVLVYSEFGREVKANGSFGTDHGHAAPVFVFSTDPINQKIIGGTPDLSGKVVPHEFDFRQVYRSILDNMGMDSQKVLSRDFAPLPIFQSAAPPAKEIYDVIQSQRAGLKYTLFTDKTWE